MKFGETFMECRHGNEERFLEKCSHVEYKRLKKVLKSCSKTCATKRGSCPSSGQDDDDDGNRTWIRDFCQCEACPLCDQMFFSELMKEASEIAGFSSRADISPSSYCYWNANVLFTFMSMIHK